MTPIANSRIKALPPSWAMVAALAVSTVVAGISPVRAQSEDAEKILKAMSDYLAGQKTISATFSSDIEVITVDLQKLQFDASGQLLLSRPDKLRVSRTGGYTDIELVFDGQTATIFGKNLDAFAQFAAPGSTDQLFDRLRNDYSVDAPGADLLLTRSYDGLMSDVIDAKHIGRGVVDGVECEHLAFRGQDIDWQIWIEVGARPIPHKYVITSKAVTGAPQYTLRLSDWKSDPAFSADAFMFKPPAGTKKVEAAALSNIDEVPPGVVIGGRQ